ncbi:UvrD-helicase domain-containing protein [Bacillus massiliigorillae]|uniref:UvrD-helicase domain-containing protein n=1 Tax=Bacillus massiliigorillae TaxID=1243664 RepID=UPI0003A169EE|nr:ATP-dependent helicase [Bacillus massiliigorillae]
MKTAKFHQEMIELANLSAELLQHTIERGKKGLLTCPVCGDTVRLYLGISKEPHFYHIDKSKPPCDCTPVSASQQLKQDAYIEKNGFRLPTSRSITKEIEPFAYKHSKNIGGNPAFLPTIPKKSEQVHPFIIALQNQGVVLDDDQLEAVTTIDGPLLVLSGAGSGKTRVLTARTAFLLQAANVAASNILLVTFTAKAAKEMKERMLGYPNITPADVNALVSGTFHSIFYKILLFHERERWQSTALIKYDWEKENMLKVAGRERGLDDKEFAYDGALQQIGLWKNSLLFPNDIRPQDKWEEDCLYLYKKYESLKNSAGKFDFDDMLIGCYKLLINNPDILEKYQHRFHYILIDEFQDINKVQYELMKMLAKISNNICVVGDDDQSIYSFRGSDPSFILHFERDFPKTKVIKLAQNYRSSHEIVATANRIIAKNEKRKAKTMLAQHDEGTAPVLFYPHDEEQEATMIVTDIAEKIEQGADPNDFAILYRTHTMSRAIFERLAESNLPFVIDQDAEAFYQRRTVKNMLAFIRLSLNEDDIDACADLLPALFLKHGLIQEIKAQMILQDCNALTALSKIKTGHTFQERKLAKLPGQIRSLQSLSPLAALERIEKDLGFSDYVKKRGNEGNKMERGSDDVRNLKVAAKRFTDCDSFIQHANHMSAMNKEVKKLSKHFPKAVTLTTIHRSKGLEYSNVYILSAVDGGLPHDYAMDDFRKGNKHALEEERRLMYVAATRAQNQLYFSVLQNRGGKTAYPSRFLYI